MRKLGNGLLPQVLVQDASGLKKTLKNYHKSFEMLGWAKKSRSADFYLFAARRQLADSRLFFHEN
jgi:hypothetical protein